MAGSLGLTVVLYSLALALVLAVVAVGGRRRPSAAGAGLVVLEAAALGQGLFDVADLLRGRHGPEVVTTLGYLLTSLAVLPVCASAVRMDAGRWGSAGLAVGCLLLAVVSIRLHQTLGTSRG